MNRRNLLKKAALFGTFGMLTPSLRLLASQQQHIVGSTTDIDDRRYWVQLADKIASPMLSLMSRGELRRYMDMQVSPIWDNRDKGVGYLEALGRLAVGIAPWLTLAASDVSEKAVQKRLKRQLLASIAHGADPKSPDYLSWDAGSQPLVDAAFLAQAFLKAPQGLWEPLEKVTKKQLIDEFKKLRRVRPGNNNWVLFSAIIESFLLSVGEQYDAGRIDIAIGKINGWYKGDGWYGDGALFSFDYYNSYVIQPMLIDVLRENVKHQRHSQETFDIAYKRMQRYAACLERLISPEGTYPIFGRSATYRTAAFQPLAQLALEDALPPTIKPAQVRCALTAVKKRVFVAQTFTKENWLTLGVVGDEQGGMADSYSNTGSMYLTSVSFLPLGLPESHDFWSAPFTPWTMLKAWDGEPIDRDHSVHV